MFVLIKNCNTLLMYLFFVFFWCEEENKMAMFSFNQSSCETRLMRLLQGNFFQRSWRNKVIAKWAAGRLGYKGDKMNAYVRNFILLYLVMPNDRKMIDRILYDFRKENIPITEDDIVSKIKSVEKRMKTKTGLTEEDAD